MNMAKIKEKDLVWKYISLPIILHEITTIINTHFMVFIPSNIIGMKAALELNSTGRIYG